MPGAHTTSPSGRLHLSSRRRRPRPTGVGWWQPPTRRRAAPEGVTGHREPAGEGGRRRSSHRRPQAPEERRAHRLRILRRTVLIGVGAAVLAPLLAFGLGYLLFSVPSPDEAVNNQVALVSFADGSTLTRLVPEEGNRIKVDISEVPQHVRDAVLAAEDRTFYSNPGFDLTGILRAVWNQVRGGSGGGSTITQQYVKNALVGNDYSLWRKYQEVILAVKISQERTKDEILGDYLNTIYFGRGAYGIQSASQAYFGKPVQLLDVSEGAMLAGLIQSPSRWDPAVSPDRAVQRWNFVLDGMVEQGRLSQAGRDAVLFPATTPSRRSAAGVPADHRGHIVTTVISELEALGITDQDLAQEGLRITTTIDPVRQQQAVDAAHAALARQPVNLRSAMVAIDPATGGVLAYYGGDNGLGLDYARARRLAGSTFKPFVVLAGLQQDPPVGLGEVYDGEELPGLRNADGADCDRCDLRQAMTVSNNVVFHTLTLEVGAEAVAAAARSAGITAPLDDPNEGIALGNKEVSAFELASAYATIAGGGVWHQPHLVEQVVTADGRVLYQASPEGERRFPDRVARNVTESMLGVAERDGLDLPGNRPVAAKTGTVQSRFEGENNDAWMAGFTPSLSTSVWIGTDMNSPIRTAGGTPISGDGLPGEVWQEFMGDALESEPVETFAPFTPIGEAPAEVMVDAPVERLADDGTDASVTPTPDPTPLTPTADPLDPDAPGGPEGAPPGSPETGSPPEDGAEDPGTDPADEPPGDTGSDTGRGPGTDPDTGTEREPDRGPLGLGPSEPETTTHPDCSVTPCG